MELTSTDPDVEISDSAAVQYKIQGGGSVCMGKQAYSVKGSQTFHVHDRLSFVKVCQSSTASKGLQTNTTTSSTELNSFQIFRETHSYSASVSVVIKFSMYRFIWSHDTIVITDNVQHLENHKVSFYTENIQQKKKKE